MDKSEMLEKLILHFSKGSATKFAKMLGIKEQALSNWRRRKTFNAETIYTGCEGVSGDWLLSGEGEMLRVKVDLNVAATANGSSSIAAGVVGGDVHHSENSELVGVLKSQIKEKDAQIERLQSQVDKLLEKLTEK